MSLIQKCPGLINSTFHGDIAPLRVAVFDGCYFTSVGFFNILLKAMKTSFILTYCDSYGVNTNGTWTGIIGKVWQNSLLSSVSRNSRECHIFHQFLLCERENGAKVLARKFLYDFSHSLLLLCRKV